MLVYVQLESWIPQAHPLRRIKALAEAALARISGRLNEKFKASGRPSVPPERLLKASILMASYSVRSDHSYARCWTSISFFAGFWT